MHAPTKAASFKTKRTWPTWHPLQCPRRKYSGSRSSHLPSTWCACTTMDCLPVTKSSWGQAITVTSRPIRGASRLCQTTTHRHNKLRFASGTRVPGLHSQRVRVRKTLGGTIASVCRECSKWVLRRATASSCATRFSLKTCRQTSPN